MMEKGYTQSNINYAVSSYIDYCTSNEPPYRESFEAYVEPYFDHAPIVLPTALLPDGYSWHYYQDGTRCLKDPDNKSLYTSDIYSCTHFESRFSDGSSEVYKHDEKLPAREDVEQAVLDRGVVAVQKIADNNKHPLINNYIGRDVLVDIVSELREGDSFAFSPSKGMIPAIIEHLEIDDNKYRYYIAVTNGADVFPLFNHDATFHAKEEARMDLIARGYYEVANDEDLLNARYIYSDSKTIFVGADLQGDKWFEHHAEPGYSNHYSFDDLMKFVYPPGVFDAGLSFNVLKCNIKDDLCSRPVYKEQSFFNEKEFWNDLETEQRGNQVSDDSNKNAMSSPSEYTDAIKKAKTDEYTLKDAQKLVAFSAKRMKEGAYDR
jgi:hypothetical protein